ncbi:MAG: hypothetical protein ABI612_16920 [Betaproteobacteria bacterium]
MFLNFVSTETFVLLTRLQVDVDLYDRWKAFARATLQRQPQREVAIGQIADALREWLYIQVPRAEGLAGTLLACSLERMNLYEVASEMLSTNTPHSADVIRSDDGDLRVESSALPEPSSRALVTVVLQA